jgi:hypothetical protein
MDSLESPSDIRRMVFVDGVPAADKIIDNFEHYETCSRCSGVIQQLHDDAQSQPAGRCR